MILLAAACAQELAFWESRPDVELLVTGVGPVEAACAVTHALSQNRYRLVISAGIAGAFEGIAQIGAGVVVAQERFALTLESDVALALPAGERTHEVTSSDAHLVEAMRRRGCPIVCGVTVARVTATERTAQRLQKTGAQVETMEGFAVLRAAERAGVPAIELRGISNRVGDRERNEWDFSAGVAGLAHVLHQFFALAGTTGDPLHAQARNLLP